MAACEKYNYNSPPLFHCIDYTSVSREEQSEEGLHHHHHTSTIADIGVADRHHTLRGAEGEKDV